MLGMVNKAVEDLARSVGGDAAWDAIRVRAGIDVVAFVSSTVYDDAVTYRLVEAACEVFSMSAADVLEAFGRHWILYTGREGYGPLLAAAGSTLPEFLRNLDAMHARVALSIPELNLPTFDVVDLDDGRTEVVYRSSREGLGPMVVGLLKGLGVLLEQQVEVTQTASRAAGADHDRFLVAVAA
jgi:hypothetical protein